MTLAPRTPVGRDQRGFALVAALLVLMLTAIVAVTYFAVTVGERQQSSNVQVARGSLYAADAGVRTVEQVLANMARAKLDSLALLWAGSGNVINNPAGLFPSGATVATSTNPGFSASGTVTFSGDSIATNIQVYDYLFTITSSGNRGPFGHRTVQSQGVLRVSASRGSFADFLLFTNVQTMPNGTDIWFTSDGHFDGRMHTNGEYRFAYKPTFEDLATSVNAKAWYYNKGSPLEKNANNNGTIDVPNFYGGFQRSTPSITLPADSYSQQNAALDGTGGDFTAPSNIEMRTEIGDLPINSNPVPTGIYFPHDSSHVLRGGIYVQGTLDRCLLKVQNGIQVYVLKQGTTTDTVKVNRTTNQTVVATSASSTTYSGVPNGMLYTNGAISDLRGPDRISDTPPPALADGTGLQVAATGDIVIQRDITYQNYDSGGSVLGIYSSGGKVRVGTSAPDDMNLDAFVMSTGTSGSFEVDSYNSGSPRGMFHLRGGLVASYYGAFYTFDVNGNLLTGYGRDYHYDRRGLVPPFYPLSPRLRADFPSARTLAWKEM